ncbi:hypothetical protein [Algivirga pacifica]|uniref:YD repeat-containing protein n=1 Tax=Algivirga pacifica TaxID=1162670 RepID=A0ABP9DG46_9BACT
MAFNTKKYVKLFFILWTLAACQKEVEVQSLEYEKKMFNNFKVLHSKTYRQQGDKYLKVQTKLERYDSEKKEYQFRVYNAWDGYSNPKEYVIKYDSNIINNKEYLLEGDSLIYMQTRSLLDFDKSNGKQLSYKIDLASGHVNIYNFEYIDNGLLIQVTNANGKILSEEKLIYDSLGRIISAYKKNTLNGNVEIYQSNHEYDDENKDGFWDIRHSKIKAIVNGERFEHIEKTERTYTLLDSTKRSAVID